MKFTVKQTTKAASRALGAVYTKFISGGGMTHDVYTKLVETVVEPVLFYGSGIWGLNNYPEVNVVLNKACRYFLGTGGNTSNIATRGDMGWNSCHVKQKLECIRMWCRLSNMPDDRITRRIHNWSTTQGRSWEKRMIRLVHDLDIADVMLVENPSKSICIVKAKEILKLSDERKWHDSLMDDSRNVANGNKLRTYRTFKKR